MVHQTIIFQSKLMTAAIVQQQKLETLYRTSNFSLVLKQKRNKIHIIFVRQQKVSLFIKSLVEDNFQELKRQKQLLKKFITH